jgi:hypothetical protein
MPGHVSLRIAQDKAETDNYVHRAPYEVPERLVLFFGLRPEQRSETGPVDSVLHLVAYTMLPTPWPGTWHTSH